MFPWPVWPRHLAFTAVAGIVATPQEHHNKKYVLDSGCFKYVLPIAIVSDGSNFGPDFDPLIHAGKQSPPQIDPLTPMLVTDCQHE